MLNEKNVSMKRFRADTIPAKGGNSDWTEMVLDDIVECERLKQLYKANKRLVGIIEKGLSTLNEKERQVLEKFYIDRPKNYLENLMEELQLERSPVYRLKDEALYKFTVNMYGITEY